MEKNEGSPNKKEWIKEENFDLWFYYNLLVYVLIDDLK